MSIEELRREVVGSRRQKRRMWFAILVGIALPAQALLMMRVLEPRETVRIVHTTTADIIAMPVPLPVEYTVNVPIERMTCPPPRTDARFVPPARLPEAITHVQPSVTNAGWIAAWNKQHVFISTDGGASWTRRLDNEAAGTVQDVSFDCYGRPIALRGGQVGVRDGDVERWRPLRDVRRFDPDQVGSDDAQLLGGGPDIVVIAHSNASEERWNARLLVSSDLGETWQGRHLVGDWEGGQIRGRQHEDGTVRAMIPVPDCMSDYAVAFRWKNGEFATIDTTGSPDLAFFGDRMFSSSGWQTIGSDESHDLPDLEQGWPTILEGPYPIAIVNDTAYRIGGKKAVKLPWAFNGDEEDLVADPAGRIWSNLCGQPHVATRDRSERCPPKPDGE